jgi:transporter family-2 protein
MLPDTVRYTAIMLAAGIGIPVLAALNAQLGTRIGSPVAAAAVLFVVACLGTALVMGLTGQTSALARTAGQPPQLFAAGLLVAFYVLTITWIAPKFGVGNAVMMVLLGQLLSAAAIDHFGLFGARLTALSLQRAAGIGLMTLGVIVAQRA